MRILGINAIYHDPAAALVVDGGIVAAAEEERFSRRKHGKRPVPFAAWELPEQAAAWCLRRAGLAACDVDAVTYSYDPALVRPAGQLGLRDPWDHLRTTYARRAPQFLAGGAAGAGSGRWSGSCRTTSRTRRPPGWPRRSASRRCWCWTGGARPSRTWPAVTRVRRAERAGQPGAAALAGPAVRGRHRAPGLPALVGRVQGDGAGLLRGPAAPAGAAGGRPGDRRRRLRHRAGRLGRAGEEAGRRRGALGRARGPRRQRADPAGGGAARAGPLAARRAPASRR